MHGGLKEFNITGKFSQSKTPFYLKVLEDIFKGDLKDKKTWLVIGCGHGEFLVAVQRYSSGEISTKGSEPNFQKQESSRKRGLNVDFFKTVLHEEKYDVI